MTFLRYLQGFLACLLLAIGCALGLKFYVTMEEAEEALQRTAYQAEQGLIEMRAAISEWREYAKASKAQLDDKQVQRGWGLLIRSGDDLARTVQKVNNTFDDLRNAIRTTNTNLNERVLPGITRAVDRTADHINDTTLPEVDRTIMATTAAITQAAESIQELALSGQVNLEASRKTIEMLARRVSDPRIDEILQSITEATEHGNQSLIHVETATKRLTKPVAWVWRGLKTGIVLTGRIFVP